MQIISYKDWLAGRHRLKGIAKLLQEDILSDDGFPDTTRREEMLAYLKKQNANNRFMRSFCISYKQYRKKVLDVCIADK